MKGQLNIVELDTVDSTSNYLAHLSAEGAPHGTVVTTHSQTAGRGQRGNTWEAEPGMNITMSMLLRAPWLPAVAPARQFALSEHVALAVASVIRPLLPRPEELAVKWPNDIYIGDRKIAGILLECAITTDGISRMVAGVGLNVNQTRFVSDAPNPISLAMITGRTYPLRPLLTEMAEAIMRFPALSEEEYPFPDTHRSYMATLWRREGLHGYRDKETGEEFEAAIEGVMPDGHLQLRHPDGRLTLHPFRTLTALL